MESAESGFDKENDFCHFIEFLFEEDDVMMQFSPTTAALHVFCYYNDQTFDIFKDLLHELNSNMEDFDLPNRG